MLDAVGLTGAARKRVGTFSLGMGQRLGLAAAPARRPPVLVLDEPVNGLDAEGIRWLRELLRAQAAEGRTVLVSSHLMAEMAQVADELIVISRGRLLAETSVREFIGRHGRTFVRVRTPNRCVRHRSSRRRAPQRCGGPRTAAWRWTACPRAR